jgi:ATP-dependent helicase Lhr and Lhr-like helicase
MRAINEQRKELGLTLRESPSVIDDDGTRVRWLTFAGGHINLTLKYAFELTTGLKVVADNFSLTLKGEGATYATVMTAIRRIALPNFWESGAIQEAILGRLPPYRLSKFQVCLPDHFAIEMVGRYLLDFNGTRRWLSPMVDSDQ